MIGIDIVEISRIDDKLIGMLLKRWTPAEVAYVASKGNSAETVAGIFAAKEAVLKCLGTGIGYGSSTEQVEITYTALGQPTATLSGRTLEVLHTLGSSVYISISHNNTTAVAVAVVR